jgi:hypothetical protein
MINTIEKRSGQPAIPGNISVYLTLKQEKALMKLCQRGWQLLFIRRQLFREARPVLMSKRRHCFSVLDSDGRISSTPRLMLRE